MQGTFLKKKRVTRGTLRGLLEGLYWAYIGFRVSQNKGGHGFVFKGLALPWFGLPLENFLQVLAFSGSWFFAPRTNERKKERNKQTNKEQKKDIYIYKVINKDRTKEGNEKKKETKKERNTKNLA